MPCRPAEYDVGRKDGERAEERVKAAIAHRHEVGRLLLHYATDPDLDLPQPLRGDLDRLASQQPDSLPPRPENAGTGRYHYPEEGSWALELMFRADREERLLCEARTVLMQLSRYRDPPHPLDGSFREQARAHRQHRSEDLEDVRAALRQRIEYFSRSEGAQSAELGLVREKLARAEKLSVDDILHDRTALESLWP